MFYFRPEGKNALLLHLLQNVIAEEQQVKKTYLHFLLLSREIELNDLNQSTVSSIKVPYQLLIRKYYRKETTESNCHIDSFSVVKDVFISNHNTNG